MATTKAENDVMQGLNKMARGSKASIQGEYVRRYPLYDAVVGAVREQLHRDVTSYFVCTWYNHWPTVLTEEYIGQHRRVVPALAKKRGVDLFFEDQPFDLKKT